MRRSVALLTLIALILTGAAAAGARQTRVGPGSVGSTREAQPQSAGAIRLVRNLPQGPTAECIPDRCTSKPVTLGTVTAPAEAQAVDVTVTLSFRYRTSPEDRGFLVVDFSPSGDRSPNMRPGSYPLNSEGRRISTSLTWVERGLPGAGTEYSFTVGAQSFDSEGPGFSKITTGRMTMVIEMWPSATAAG